MHIVLYTFLRIFVCVIWYIFAYIKTLLECDTMDNILAKREYKPVGFCAMFSAFDFEIWTYIAVSLMIYCLQSALIKRFCRSLKSIAEYYPSLARCLHFFYNSHFSCPHCSVKSLKSPVWRVSFLFWTLYTMLLKMLIGGDLVTVLTLGPQLNSIDTYEKMAKRTNVTITAFAGTADQEDVVVQKYFSLELPNRKELTSRLHLLHMEQMTDNQVVADLFREVADRRRLHLGFSITLRYCINHWFNGNYSHSFVISKEHGNIMFGNLMIRSFAAKELKSTLAFRFAFSVI